MKTVLNTLGTTGFWMTFAGEAILVMRDCRWLIVALLITIAADLWFSYNEHLHNVRKARTKRERDAEKAKWRISTALRRSLTKTVDYFSIMILGTVLGIAVGEPWDVFTHVQGGGAGLLVGVLIDGISIWGHLCAIHGQSAKLRDVPRVLLYFLLALIRNKGRAVTEAIEETYDHETNMED